MKDKLIVILGVIVSVLSMSIMSANLFLLPLGFLGFISGIKISSDRLTKNNIKNSCFMIEKNKKIEMNGEEYNISRISQNLLHINLFQSNKKEYFMLQALNLFQQLPRQEEGKNILYGCRSQAYTKKLLHDLQREGYITNFTSVVSNKKSSLIIERLLLGLKPRKKKNTMYKMTFELTDKRLNASEIPELLQKFKVDYSLYKTKIDKNNNMIFLHHKHSNIEEQYFDVATNKVQDKKDSNSPQDYSSKNRYHIDCLKSLKNNLMSEYREEKNKDVKKNS